MKKTLTFARIIAVALLSLAMGATQARAAYTVYAEDVTSNTAVMAPAPVAETNAAAAQTNLNAKSRSWDGNPQVRVDDTGVHIGGPNPMVIKMPRSGRDMESIVGILAVFGMPGAGYHDYLLCPSSPQ